MRLEDMSFYDYLVAECEYKEKQRRKKQEMRNDELLLNERVNNAVNAVLEQIRAEIEETIESYVCDTEENTMKAQGMLNAMQMTFEIIDKYRGDK